MYTLIFCDHCANKIRNLGRLKYPEMEHFYDNYQKICSIYAMTLKPVIYADDAIWGRIVSILEESGYVISSESGKVMCRVKPLGHWSASNGLGWDRDNFHRFCHAKNIDDHFGIDLEIF